MKSTRFTFLSLCVTVLLAVLLAACGTQTQPAATSELPSNFGQAEVMLPGFDKPQNVTYEIIDNYAIFEGDIILGEVDKAGQLIQSELETQGTGIRGRNFRWLEGVIPFVINASVPINGRQQILDAIAHWQANTSIRFVARQNQTDFVEFVLGTDPNACFSALGRQGNQQTIVLPPNGNCGTPTIIHEIGHTVGLFHEQSRLDRDNFVRIMSANIQAGRESQFSKHGSSDFDFGRYDYNSIMHYSCFAFSANGQPTIALINPPFGVSCNTVGRGNSLSTGDITAVRTMYTPVVVRSSTGFDFNPNQAWTDIVYFGSRGTFFADVTGDGKADAIVVNNNKVTVRRSTGSGLNGNESWTNEPYFGTRGTFFADVDGDGRADAIVVNDGGVTVRRSTGSNFSSNESWTSGPYFGTRGTFFADVNGDKRADAIVVNDNGVVVRLSLGSAVLGGFAPNESWTQGVAYFGTRGTFFADVTGDGKADAIVVNDGGVTVRRSTGSVTLGFGANESWTTVPYFGTRGTFFADVTGDGKADAIVVNDNGIVVRRSNLTGTSFNGNESWTQGVAYFGSVGTFFADVTGDKKADAIVINK
jgi:Astacin (Peptidase family M12A)/FG-GAP-like repeat